MRFPLLAAAFSTFAVAAASADPRADSLELHQAVMLRAARLMEMFQEIDGKHDNLAVADKIQNDVNEPLGDAEQLWLNSAFKTADDPEPYRPYSACSEASTNLGFFAAKIQRYLRGIDKEPFGETDARPFKVKLTECETALGLEPTFNESSAK
jgi:hypothetical protein